MTEFDIAPEIRQLIGPNGDLPLREAAHASDPVCWTCGDTIEVANQETISVIARRDDASGPPRIGFSHSGCAPSRIEEVTYDRAARNDALRNADFKLAATPDAVFAMMEQNELLQDVATGESLNQRRLKQLGCADISGTWPALHALPLTGWTHAVRADTLTIYLPGGDAAGRWTLGPISPDAIDQKPLLLLIGERVGLDNFDETRFAMAIDAGAVIGGYIPKPHRSRIKRILRRIRSQ